MAENEDQMAENEDQRPITAYPDSMGPEIHSGGTQEVGGLVPPYEGRQESASDSGPDTITGESEDQRPITANPDSMGPDIHSGGTQEFGVPLPPYVGRKGGPGPDTITGESENPPPREISEA